MELNSRKVSNLNSPSNSESQRNLKKGGSIISQFVIDEIIIRCLGEFGYLKEYLIKSLYANELNYATSTYYLILNSKL